MARTLRSLSVARRFSLAYLALAALLGVAIGTFVVLVERPAPLPPPPWSAWQPTKTARVARQLQIATHVAAQYRLGGGKQLVDVVVRDPQKEPAIQDIALTRTLYPTQRSDYISAVGTDKSAMCPTLSLLWSIRWCAFMYAWPMICATMRRLSRSASTGAIGL